MLIRIGQFDCTECWDGVFYKKLSDYPRITEWEIQSVLDFMEYEKDNGRECIIEADKSVEDAIEAYKTTYNTGKRIPVPPLITECTACPSYKGCMTDFVCHTSPIVNAVKILKCGKLLSPIIARNMPAKELKAEKANAANDPEDFFEYIMFAWGNCQAGDRLVMERKLGRFPTEEDLSIRFTPGVRFFFFFDKLIKHPNAVFDGVLPLKIKNEVVLSDWVHAVVVPEEYREITENCVPETLRSRVFYIANDCRDIWEWSAKVYEFVKCIAH